MPPTAGAPSSLGLILRQNYTLNEMLRFLKHGSPVSAVRSGIADAAGSLAFSNSPSHHGRSFRCVRGTR